MFGCGECCVIMWCGFGYLCAVGIVELCAVGCVCLVVEVGFSLGSLLGWMIFCGVGIIQVLGGFGGFRVVLDSS